MTNGSWRIGDELSFREAKPETAQVMELELPQRVQMRARFLALRGFRIARITRDRCFAVNEFGEPRDLLRIRSRETSHAADRASR